MRKSNEFKRESNETFIKEVAIGENKFTVKSVLPLVAVLLFNANVAYSLKLDSTEEGACFEFPVNEDVNMTWVENNVENLKYFGGGNKYNMYAVAALHPTFDTMREFEFYYNSCFAPRFDLSSGQLSTYGFGEDLGDFILRLGNPETEPGIIYFDKIGGSTLTLKHRITLTDYESFIFFATCWVESNQRAWAVATFKPNPNEATRKIIEDHALSMGFQREQFIFFRYETCQIS